MDRNLKLLELLAMIHLDLGRALHDCSCYWCKSDQAKSIYGCLHSGYAFDIADKAASLEKIVEHWVAFLIKSGQQTLRSSNEKPDSI